MRLARVLVLGWSVASMACASAIVGPAARSSKPAVDALLVLPGFGYSRAGERALKSLAPAMAADGVDLYVPTFVARSGLEASRQRLRRFILEQQLERYARVHVFAFIAGGWTLNPLVETDVLPNLSTVVYDRSPYQERAPIVAMQRLHVLTWIKYGPVVFDVARTPYSPMERPDVRVGLVVETRPTSFIKRFEGSARKLGPYRFECDAFAQRYDDCLYVAMSHDQLYTRFAEVWPDVRALIRSGQFTRAADRTPPSKGDEENATPNSQSTVSVMRLPVRLEVGSWKLGVDRRCSGGLDPR